MVKVGDFFPGFLKSAHIDRSLVPGRILYLDCEFTKPPKEKFLVLLCARPEPLVFVINSRIPRLAQQRSDLRKSQVSLYASDYECLSHDSYLDCSKVFPLRSLQYVKNQLSRDLSRIKGIINDTNKHEIIEVVSKSRILSNYHKRLIVTSLSR